MVMVWKHPSTWVNEQGSDAPQVCQSNKRKLRGTTLEGRTTKLILEDTTAQNAEPLLCDLFAFRVEAIPLLVRMVKDLLFRHWPLLRHARLGVRRQIQRYHEDDLHAVHFP